jgi:hypothetical protein
MRTLMLSSWKVQPVRTLDNEPGAHSAHSWVNWRSHFANAISVAAAPALRRSRRLTGVSPQTCKPRCRFPGTARRNTASKVQQCDPFSIRYRIKQANPGLSLSPILSNKIPRCRRSTPKPQNRKWRRGRSHETLCWRRQS